jgi:hypothetical protein
VALQPFNPYSSSRIAHAALVEIKSRCGLWGHIGLPLADILRWLELTYGLDREKCREALILGSEKAGLHIDEGRNSHVYLAAHWRAELSTFKIVQALAPRRQPVKCVPAKSARVMVGTDKEKVVKFSKIQRDCLTGIIECVLSILTGGPGAGKSTLLAALEDHYENFAHRRASRQGRFARARNHRGASRDYRSGLAQSRR